MMPFTSLIHRCRQVIKTHREHSCCLKLKRHNKMQWSFLQLLENSLLMDRIIHIQKSFEPLTSFLDPLKMSLAIPRVSLDLLLTKESLISLLALLGRPLKQQSSSSAICNHLGSRTSTMTKNKMLLFTTTATFN